jgi:hypothetical protein
MTEQDWLESDDPIAMLKHLRKQQVGRTRIGKRRLRLFCCACARRIERQYDENERRALEVAERFADERADKAELAQAWTTVMNSPWKQPFTMISHCAGWALVACVSLHGLSVNAQNCTYQVAIVVTDQDGEPAALVGELRHPGETTTQADRLRCIFGNPFHPPVKRRFPAEVSSLAEACREGDSGAYPILADALADLGEEAAATHCREGGHVKGCHIVDWVLGKR